MVQTLRPVADTSASWLVSGCVSCRLSIWSRRATMSPGRASWPTRSSRPPTRTWAGGGGGLTPTRPGRHPADGPRHGLTAASHGRQMQPPLQVTENSRPHLHVPDRVIGSVVPPATWPQFPTHAPQLGQYRSFATLHPSFPQPRALPPATHLRNGQAQRHRSRGSTATGSSRRLAFAGTAGEPF